MVRFGYMSGPVSVADIKNFRRMIQSIRKSYFGSIVRGLLNFWIGSITNEARKCGLENRKSTTEQDDAHLPPARSLALLKSRSGTKFLKLRRPRCRCNGFEEPQL